MEIWSRSYWTRCLLFLMHCCTSLLTNCRPSLSLENITVFRRILFLKTKFRWLLTPGNFLGNRNSLWSRLATISTPRKAARINRAIHFKTLMPPIAQWASFPLCILSVHSFSGANSIHGFITVQITTIYLHARLRVDLEGVVLSRKTQKRAQKWGESERIIEGVRAFRVGGGWIWPATLHSGVFHFNGPQGNWLTRPDPSAFQHNGPLHYLFVLANVLVHQENRGKSFPHLEIDFNLPFWLKGRKLSHRIQVVSIFLSLISLEDVIQRTMQSKVDKI